MRAATAKAVPELSVSTTVRTAPEAAAAGLAPTGAPALGTGAAGVPGLGAGVPAPGRGGLVAAGIATVEDAGLAPPTVAGRGGSEILMVSFLRSPGGLAIAGTGGGPPAGTGIGGAGGLGKEGAPGTVGAPGTAGFGGGASRIVSFLTPAGGAGGANGFGAGARRTVSFLTAGEGVGREVPSGLATGAVRPGGLIRGAPGGVGGFGKGTAPGALGGLGGVGGKGTPSAIRR